MSVVVEQTLPYSISELNLDDPTRWSRLFPLIRPSIKTAELSNGHTVIVDTSLSTSKKVLLAAVANVGNFSSKILSDSHLSLFTTEQSGKQSLSAEGIYRFLRESGYPTENGLVVLRSASKTEVRAVTERVVEVSVVGELKLNHALALLSDSNTDTKTSFEKTKSLLEHFTNFVTKTTSTFHEQKSGDAPSIENEAGRFQFNSAKEALDKDLGHLLGSKSAEPGIYSLHYSDINGLSQLENNILAHEISEYLANRNLPTHISQSTILKAESQARGWAISLCIVPTTFLAAQEPPLNTLSQSTTSISIPKPINRTSKIQISDAHVRKVIIAGCESVIKDEPTITEYDTIVGDGDCGYTLRDGAKQILNFISNADLSELPSTLSNLVDDLEVNMGGTSGALYCIFLSSLAQQLLEAPSFPDALNSSLNELLKYTRARLGDRTCLDCLIPFVETLKRTGDSKEALREAEKGVETTKKLEAKLGRSSYLDEAATRGVPDPGAYGLLKILEGMVAAQ